MSEVYDARPCRLGEGPLWHPERQQLFWFDIPGGRLLTREGDAPKEWTFGETVSAAGWVDRDALLIAGETSLFTFDLVGEAAQEVVPLEAENMETRSNDGRADPWGGFWIGTMGKHAEPQAGAIYRLYSGQIRRIISGLTIPNAICFAPDGRLAYYTDTPTRQVMAQPLGRDGWPEGAPHVAVDLRADRLNPDGAVTDSEGNLWIAQWAAGRVAVYTPEGRFLRAVAVGARQSTCPAFGGAALDQLFVTTAREGLDGAALAADPLAGQLFRCQPGARGRAEPRVIL
ncbi:SMP-30/gluconolactonase/LRE family protein [Sinisalibacter aestuarii]|uniref:Gluconolactonase n=1 Tax=Sinisalibacter aestuarii TaxID=2949426 RepID=A0ABQ5LNI2_9RHOB|nr:SMP-30/gluconolactonase/LRE family protein [Sinisalibacter aestuarii]GKY86564.1 gluconolactonase [Sinisalibacter aestuarii]